MISSSFNVFSQFSENNKSHWDKVYSTYSPDQLGWYQKQPEISLKLIAETGLDLDAQIIDIGGGTSLLASLLLKQGYKKLTVFDISSSALCVAQQALAEQAGDINWIEGDILSYTFDQQYDVWHDRAVFHFLTNADDRFKYLQTLNRSLSANGHFLISCFSPEAPAKCSGLPVVRYTPELLQNEIGSEFELVNSREELHQTPTGVEQRFISCHFKRTVDPI